MKKKVFREERLHMIMEMLFEQKSVSVDQLTRKFDKSAGMIRLDLAELETRGLISRTHGGAIWCRIPRKICLRKEFTAIAS